MNEALKHGLEALAVTMPLGFAGILFLQRFCIQQGDVRRPAIAVPIKALTVVTGEQFSNDDEIIDAEIVEEVA